MYTCFDLETTGLSTYHGAIVEVAAIRTFADGSTREFCTLVSPHCEVESGAFRVHGISTTEARTRGGQPREVFEDLQEFIGDSTVIAHNGIKFDVPYLRTEMTRHGLNIGNNRVIDTVRLARHYLCAPGESAKLAALCARCGIINERAHRALADTRATLELFKLILKTEPDLDTLWKLSGSVSMMDLGGRHEFHKAISDAIIHGLDIEINYKSQGKPPRRRWLKPRGFLPDGNGDYKFAAHCYDSQAEKNYVIGRILEILGTRKSS
ncbi:MAG: 3'-5' exonuclease [Deltaproteobacteria bacterium]|nr:3'-5' exonuclease [Deltaproteobacteria bacterium]